MKQLLLILVILLVVSGCKMDNTRKGSEYKDSDFVVACLSGHNYLIERTGWRMAPKYDPITHLPEACGVQPPVQFLVKPAN